MIDLNTLPLKTSQLDYGKARAYAQQQHKAIKQKYDGKLDYSHHLNGVEWYAKWHADLLEQDMGDMDYYWLALAGAQVHDLLEDCPVSYNDVVKATNVEIAELAFLLATPKGRTRAERHCDAYYQEISTSLVATFVKLCDRLANLQYSLDNKSRMFYRYKEEHEHFQKLLRPAWPQLEPLWDALDSKVRYVPYPSFT